MEYLWMYVLVAIAVVSLGGFFMTFSRDMTLTKRLKLSKGSLFLNFSLLVISFGAVSLIIYLFLTLKAQLNFLT